jgi:nucleoside-diphosphate-sugar epimerase
MTILIAGCGDLGTEVGLRFAAAGRRVIGIRRAIHRLPDAIEGQSRDLRSENPTVPADTDTVVIALTAGQRSAEAYRATYVDGLAHVLDGIEDGGAEPRRIILVSSTAVYDVSDGSTVDESTPAVPATPTATVLRESELLLHRRVPGASVLRLGGIYGPGRERLLTQVREGSARTPTTSMLTNRIHRDDAAAAIVHLALRPEAPDPVYLGVDDTPAQLGEVLAFLAAEMNLPKPPPGETASREGGGDKCCSNTLLRSTGYEFIYPGYREGYRAVLAGHGIRHP